MIILDLVLSTIVSLYQWVLTDSLVNICIVLQKGCNQLVFDWFMCPKACCSNNNNRVKSWKNRLFCCFMDAFLFTKRIIFNSSFKAIHILCKKIQIKHRKKLLSSSKSLLKIVIHDFFALLVSTFPFKRR